MNNHRTNQRRGVTLLFVITMIVLFLLMGTTFVVLSNDFLRSSRLRSRITVDSIESLGENRGEKFLTQALFDLLREPDLNNSNSPLRGHSLLGDMYGYGFTAFVKNVQDSLIEMPNTSGSTSGNPQFIRIELIAPGIDTFNNTITLDAFDQGNNIVIGNDIMTGRPIVTTEPDVAFSGDELPPYELLPPAPGRFNGQLLSFVTGPAKGITARIIDHQVFTLEDSEFDDGVRYEHRFVLMLLNAPAEFTPGRIVDANGRDDLIVPFDDLVNDADDPRFPTQVVINGRPFSGTGAGTFDPEKTLNQAALSAEARRPNQIGKRRDELIGELTPPPMDSYLSRWTEAPDGTRLRTANSYATNESYDAVDLQNMFLAGRDATGTMVASFNRVALGPASSFRPIHVPNSSLSTASANFPNSMQPFAMDVDNDADGEPDGIWMDIALPMYSNADGTRIKPLVSYHVVDLDSKINVNVHGNRTQIASNDRFADGVIAETDLLGPLNIPTGVGFGPAEINLAAVFPNEFERLLIGDILPGNGNVVITPGRYGFSENDRRRRNGGGPAPGRGYVSMDQLGQEPFSAYKLFGYPNFGVVPGGVLGGLFQSSPMDIYGRFRTVFPNVTDFGGSAVPISMPVIDIVETSLTFHSELINNPYEVDFSPPPHTESFYDRLYTLEELEQVYRPNDSDLVGTPPSRLPILAPSLRDPLNRMVATTESWEVPTVFQDFVGGVENGDLESLVGKLYSVLKTTSNPNFGLPGNPTTATQLIQREREILANISGFVHDLGGGSNPVPDRTFLLDSGNDPDALSRGMLSADVRSGRPFNVNQPFGNGQDDNGDGVIDNLGENDTLGHPDGVLRDFDHDNDSVITGNAIRARQLFARQLYILALLATELVDRNGNGSVIDDADFRFEGQTGPAARLAYRRVIAQWAINVVDFRDPDSIMTPFEVDLNPWNGWDVDGNFATNEVTAGILPAQEYARLWGTERPELLITETIAMHDRRTQDTMDDPTGNDMSSDPPDPHPDSRLVPVASAFFELYNPWVMDQNQRFPAELYGGNQTGVDLRSTDPENNPVWRMVVVQGRNTLLGPNAFDPIVDPDEANPPLPIQRYIYFNTPTAAGLMDEGVNESLVYFPVDGVGSQIVEPGKYAVVGSSGVRNGDIYTTYLGRRSDAIEPDPTNAAADVLNLDMTRRIELNLANNLVNVQGSDPNNNSVSTDVAILPVNGPFTVAPANRRSLGLSDPPEGYVNVRIEGPGSEILQVVQGADGPYFFSAALGERATADVPADIQVNQQFNGILQEDGLRNSMYVVLLQRLANPLEPFDREANPYRTCDSSSVDLFAFNGVESDSMPSGEPVPEIHFGTYERRSDLMDSNRNQNEMTGRYRMWKTEYEGLNPTMDSMNASPDPADLHVFPKDLIQSLGRLNQAYIAANTNGERPFSWLTWNNRPYASALEIANVPFTSSFFLTNRFDISLKRAGVFTDVYNQNFNPINPYRATSISGEFPHLLNFHADGDEAPLLHRIFDYVEVPSRYVGTETFLNPDNFRSTAATTNGVMHHMTQAFAQPFDYVSNYRQPGKININTISDERVWNALMGSYATSLPFQTWAMQRVNNPYRASNANNRVPEIGVSTATPNKPADAGLFRRGSGPTIPLLDFAPSGGSDPLELTSRNAFYKYHQRQRLGNLVTMRSSVFAIWITVGYFEVESESVQNADGDDVTIDVVGAEVTDEFDRTTRNRGFFIFDRSIPVAFEPGKNHNVERAIRVSSYIE